MKRPAHWKVPQQEPSRHAVLAALEDIADSCGWCSLADMKRSVLAARGLYELNMPWQDGVAE